MLKYITYGSREKKLGHARTTAGREVLSRSHLASQLATCSDRVQPSSVLDPSCYDIPCKYQKQQFFGF